jgi:hypothetical protein
VSDLQKEKRVYRSNKRPLLFIPLLCIPIIFFNVGQMELFSEQHEHANLSLFGAFSSLRLNEMGDFLAGVFGSLAFLAAAIAVFMQSAELSAQREELGLIRKEHAGQRRATEQMVDATRSQVDMLKNASRQRFEEQKKDELEQRLEALRLYLTSLRKVEAFGFLSDSIGRDGIKLEGKVIPFKPFEELDSKANSDSAVRLCAEKMKSCLDFLANLEGTEKLVRCAEHKQWVELLDRCNDALILKEELGGSQIIRLENTGIEALSNDVAVFVEKDIWDKTK